MNDLTNINTGVYGGSTLQYCTVRSAKIFTHRIRTAASLPPPTVSLSVFLFFSTISSLLRIGDNSSTRPKKNKCRRLRAAASMATPLDSRRQ